MVSVSHSAPSAAGRLVELPLSEIVVDPALQMRDRVDPRAVERYADHYREGRPLPPLVVFDTGRKKLLADGFTRREALLKAGLGTAECVVRTGTWRDAWLFALGVNAEHGVPRSDRTIERVIRSAFADDELRTWADGRIATLCRISSSTVGRWRKRLEAEGTLAPARVRQGADGRTRDVQGIGRRIRPDEDGTVTPVTVETGFGVEGEPDEATVAPVGVNPEPEPVAASPAPTDEVRIRDEVNRLWVAAKRLPEDSPVRAEVLRGFEHLVHLLSAGESPFQLVAADAPQPGFVLEPTAPAATKPRSVSAQADAIYQAYPRKVGKTDALRAIEKALKKVPFDTLLEAVDEYARCRKGQDERFIPHPATWFNRGQWEDDRKEWKRPLGSAATPYVPGPGEVYVPGYVPDDPF